MIKALIKVMIIFIIMIIVIIVIIMIILLIAMIKKTLMKNVNFLKSNNLLF